MDTSMAPRKKWIVAVATLLVLAVIALAVWLVTRSGHGDSQAVPSPTASSTTVASTPTPSETTPSTAASPSASSATPSTVAPTTSQPTTSTSTTTPSTQTGGTVETKPFNGYTIKLPSGTELVSTKKGEWGDVRMLYKTPDGKYIEVISLTADYKYREFTEEITTANPDAKSGNFYDKFTWGGSLKGHGETWIHLNVKVDGHHYDYFYLYTTTSDADNVIVIEYGTTTPSRWLLKAIEQATWTEEE